MSRQDVNILYPPCEVNMISLDKVVDKANNYTIVSLGQFRPEKNHSRQIEILDQFFNENPKYREHVCLYIIGGCRGLQDLELFSNLAKQIEKRGLKGNIKLIKNCSENEKKAILENASVGLHTMESEHFGISIIEMMVL